MNIENGNKIPISLYLFFILVRLFRLGILEKYPRRASASFWTDLELRKPNFDRCRNLCTFVFVFIRFVNPKNAKLQFVLLVSKEQALKPCPDCRSRDSAQIRLIESSPNPNLTDLVKKQAPDFHSSR